jgi:alkanesulfonate monooxygenase SsuD/methylene tetrahydromethanopterin reductase-like flavin-dependent oxidoreductase (luciferase family)
MGGRTRADHLQSHRCAPRCLGIATAATNHATRHPMVTASFAMTMHKLAGGRFSLGLGRGIAPLFNAFGLCRAMATCW